MLNTPRDNEVSSNMSLAEATESSWNELLSMVKGLKDSLLRALKKPVAAIGTAAILMSPGCVEGDMSAEEDKGDLEQSEYPVAAYVVETIDENTFELNGVLMQPSVLNVAFYDDKNALVYSFDTELDAGKFEQIVDAPTGSKTLSASVDGVALPNFDVDYLSSLAGGAVAPDRDDEFL